MDLLTILFLTIFLASFISLIILIIFKIFTIFSKKDYSNYILISKFGYVITSLIVTFFLSGTVAINYQLRDEAPTSILVEKSPNKDFVLQIDSSPSNHGQHVIVSAYYTNNFSIKTPSRPLLDESIDVLSPELSKENLDLKWIDNAAYLTLYDMYSPIYIKVWIDDKTNKFMVESSHHYDEIFK